ncbi:MAG: cell division protein FtsA [Alphaproteobacteria bacterium]|nr:cell division protein FtsA [Alphaproteobacteria bacterium]
MGETVRLRAAEPAPAYRTGVIAALDIGSTKIACLIGRSEPGQLRVMGTALRESLGIRSGTVTDMMLAEESIREAVGAAENHADMRVQNVLISVSCGAPKSITARAAMALDGELVEDSHLRFLLKDAEDRCRLEDHELVQCAPTGYVVDEARGVRNPIGMFCRRLGVTTHGVVVQPSPFHNLKLAVERSHLKVAGTQFSAFASGQAVLAEDEKQLGATLIDLGGGTTSVAVFLEGHLVFVDVIPLGGQHVTGDIARMLSEPLAAAERTKTLFGAAIGDLTAGADVVSVPQMGEDGEEGAIRVPRSMLTRIIQARLEEIFGQVQERLRKAGMDVAAGRRAVLTGGASQLAGTGELAARILNKQVRLGRPQHLAGLPAASAGPDYATAVGLFISGATMAPEALNPDAEQRSDDRERSLFSRLTGGLFG